MKKLFNETSFTRWIATLLFIAILATHWDVWWHGAIGRDTFWELPHIFLYGSVTLAIILGVYGFLKTKHRQWRNLAIVLLLIPVAGPFDELWHTLFGREALNSILIAWSPPHLLIVGTFLASFLMLLPLISKEKDLTAKRFYGAASLAVILSVASFVTAPLEPTGSWGLLGFYGAGIFAFFLVSIFLASQKWLSGIGQATLVSIFIILLSSITFGEVVNPEVEIIPHAHPPSFLIVFSFLAAAGLMDFLKAQSELIRGIVGSFVWAFILYFFASNFFEPEFQYSLVQAWQAIGSAVIGGSLAGVIFRKVSLKELSVKPNN